MSIETETVLLPGIIADCVVREGAAKVPALQTAPDSEYAAIADLLTDRAERCYAADRHFHQLLDGRYGRDNLYAFMRHWFSAIALQRWHIRMPSHFCLGSPL